MDDFSQILELVFRQLQQGDSELEVRRAYPAKYRANPQGAKLAVVGIQRVKLDAVGMQNFYGGQTMPLGRQASVWVKVSFCCRSGEECWKLWESCAQGLLFSQQLKVNEIECGEAAFQKDWGGVVLPVVLELSFLISGSDGEQSGTKLEEIRVIRKGAVE